MAFFRTDNVRIAGIAACVPRQEERNDQLALLTPEEAARLSASTGIERRRKAPREVCASDLCFKAAERLLDELGWRREEVDCLIFVSQSPDYYLPATACILQDRLGLSEECYALDISLGCSGWVYGLSVIGGLLSRGDMKRGLLMVGDTSSLCSPKDKSTYPLFGDAGAVTALEFVPGAGEIKFHLATDGSGYKAIMIPHGSCRHLPSAESLVMEEIEPGVERSPLHMILDGMDVFSFGITKVPQGVRKFADHYGLDMEKVDYFLFHQANLMLNEHIRKKLKLPAEKVPYSLRDFGNTSSATIPLTMVTQLAEPLRKSELSLMACGFGVGLSWATAAFRTNGIVCCDLIEY